MSRISRRTFLASAVAAAAPGGQAAAAGDYDFVVIGAGAAGIAAARRLGAAGRRYAVIEAADQIGGRCVTDTRIFGLPFDRGAHWIHMPDINPLASLGQRAGVDIYMAPPGQRVRIGRRNAREGEMEDFLSTLVRSSRAIQEGSRKTDVSCAQALPKDLLTWKNTVEFVLGPFGCGKDLNEVSSQDFAKSAERDVDAFSRLGFGALLAKLAQGVQVQTGTAATRISYGGRTGGVEIETTKGRFGARAVIVTVSTGILGAANIKFAPDLPKRQQEALAKLKLGSYDHIALELPGNPLALQRDELVYEKSEGNRTAALLANVSGTPLHLVDVGGRFGRELSGQGEAAMVAFALEWLSGLYGIDVKKAVKRTSATRWNADPLALGAFSAASPGGQWARTAMMEPLGGNRVWFAGEAVHETLWGTVGGAWASGDRAADTALRRLGYVTDPKPAVAAKTRRR